MKDETGVSGDKVEWSAGELRPQREWSPRTYSTQRRRSGIEAKGPALKPARAAAGNLVRFKESCAHSSGLRQQSSAEATGPGAYHCERAHLSAFSKVPVMLLESGVVVELQRSRILPSFPTMNFTKFQPMSSLVFSLAVRKA